MFDCQRSCWIAAHHSEGCIGGKDSDDVRGVLSKVQHLAYPLFVSLDSEFEQFVKVQAEIFE
jgi:hypothetical protein